MGAPDCGCILTELSLPFSAARQPREAVLFLLWQAVTRLDTAGVVTLPDALAFTASRPFNMKGQEFEELVAHLLDEQLAQICAGSPFPVSVHTTQDKRLPDLVLRLGGDSYPFSVKNYSTTRVQVATLADHLDHFVEQYADEGLVGCDLPAWQVEQLKTELADRLPEEFTLFALTQQDPSGLSTWLAALNSPEFLSPVNRVRIERTTGKTSHLKLQFFFAGVEQAVLSLALGLNALNRGLWFENGRRHMGDSAVVGPLFKILQHRTGQDVTIWKKLSDRQRMAQLLMLLAQHKQTSRFAA